MSNLLFLAVQVAQNLLLLLWMVFQGLNCTFTFIDGLHKLLLLVSNLASASLHKTIQGVKRLELFFVALSRVLPDLVDAVSVAHVFLPRNTGPHFANQLLVPS